MVLDAERNLLAVRNEYIFLTPNENIILNLIIQNNKTGINTKILQRYIYPYNCCITPLISRLNKKIKKYAEIYQESRKYKIYCYRKSL